MNRSLRTLCVSAMAAVIMLAVSPAWGSGEIETAAEAAQAPVTYTWLTLDQSPFEADDPTSLWRRFVDETGVMIDFIYVPRADYDTKVSVTLASGDLPDIMNVSSTIVHKYGPRGAFLPVEDLIVKYAPNITKFIVRDDAVYKALKSPDGHLYSVNKLETDPTMRASYTFGYRTDLLDELKEKQPASTDDWVRVLRKAKEAYPTMIPLTIPGARGYHKYVAGIFRASWGLYFDFDAGKFRYGPLTDNLKETVTFLAQLYRDKLLDAEFLTLTPPVVRTKLTNGQAFSYFAYYSEGRKAELANLATDPNTKIRFVIPPPPQTAMGPSKYEASEYIGAMGTVLKKAINSPARALQFIDLVGFTPAGATSLQLGVEGLQWEIRNGNPEFTQAFLKSPEFTTLRQSQTPGVAAYNAGANDYLPGVRMASFYSGGLQASLADLPEVQRDLVDRVAIAKWLDTRVQPSVTRLMSEEEFTKAASIQTTCDTLFDEAALSMIFGKRPLSEWNQLVADLKKNRAEDLEAIYNRAYATY